MYRGELKGLYVLLNMTQAGPGRAVKQEQEQKFRSQVQGDTSGRTKPPVDIEVKVVFYYKDPILKRNFQINVNRRFGRT